MTSRQMTPDEQRPRRPLTSRFAMNDTVRTTTGHPGPEGADPGTNSTCHGHRHRWESPSADRRLPASSRPRMLGEHCCESEQLAQRRRIERLDVEAVATPGHDVDE